MLHCNTVTAPLHFNTGTSMSTEAHSREQKLREVAIVRLDMFQEPIFLALAKLGKWQEKPSWVYGGNFKVGNICPTLHIALWHIFSKRQYVRKENYCFLSQFLLFNNHLLSLLFLWLLFLFLDISSIYIYHVLTIIRRVVSAAQSSSFISLSASPPLMSLCNPMHKWTAKYWHEVEHIAAL